MASVQECPAGESLLAYLQEHVDALADQGQRARDDKPDSVHQVRIAIRRIGTALDSYRKLLSSDDRKRLATELKWLTGATGPVRDAEVMHKRLTRLVAEEPEDLVVGPVGARIDELLGTEFEVGRLKCHEALESDRYVRLLEALGEFLKDPTLTSMAQVPAGKILPILIERERGRLDKAVSKGLLATESVHRDDALHDVRKRARRLRYAAEVAVPLGLERTDQLMNGAHDLQKILGNQHDSVVIRARLVSMRAEAEVWGESGFTYGRLHGVEQIRAEESEVSFLRAWKNFPPTL